jgi:protein O-GlcNAc transferase
VHGKEFRGARGREPAQCRGASWTVTRNLDEYEALALKLASDPVLIALVRQKLDGNRKTYPLFNTDRLRRHIESAYMTMWDIAQRGEPPRGFAVEPA